MLQKQLYTEKYINAEIRDDEKGFIVRHIKHRIGPYFITEIGGFYYVFKLNEEIYRQKEQGLPRIEVVTYTTDHYLPLDNKCKLLEYTLDENKINKIDPMMADIFKDLGDKEKGETKEDFTPHDLDKMIKEVSNYENSKISKIIPKNEQKYLVKKKIILNYLNNLEKKKIVTPVRKVSNFIEGNLRTTDPQFLASIHLVLGNSDIENKKVSNQPISKGRPWLKYAAFAVIAIMIIGIIYYAWDSGFLDTLSTVGEGFKGLPNPVGGIQAGTSGRNDQYYQDNFTPQELRAKVDAGEINIDSLPPKTKALVEATPSAKEIQIGGN